MTAEIKNNILHRAEGLFLKYGVKSVTMDDIARELAVSKKTLYQFFENKNDLLEQVAEHNFSNDLFQIEEIKRLSTDALDEMMRIARHILSELARIQSPTMFYDLQKYHRELWLKFEKHNDETVFQHIKNNIERGVSEGLYRTDLDADIIAKIYVNNMNLIIMDSHAMQTREDRTRLFRQTFSYHTHGIATPRGLELLEKRLTEL